MAKKHVPASRKKILRSIEDRRNHGARLREKSKRSIHAKWQPSRQRPDPVQLLLEANLGRIPELLPVKWGRMCKSPFGFLRGAAPLMAADLALMPSTGLTVQICGDAHVLNLGAYAGPNGALVFDINDFDETIRGPWEWDVKRMAASLVVAGQESQDADSSDFSETVLAFMHAYRESMQQFAGMPVIELLKHEIIFDDTSGPVYEVLQEAKKQDHASILRKFTETGKNGFPRFKDSKVVPSMPSLKRRVEGSERADVLAALASYRETMGAARRSVLDAYHPEDVLFKVVGTGSVGTKNYIVMFFGNGPTDPLFLQLKQELPSCYEKYLPDAPKSNSQAQRVAEGQHCIQTVTDPFVGWTAIRSEQYLVRQFSDHKAKIDTTHLSASALGEYGAVCGKILAKCHARTGDAAAIAGYCGKSDKFDQAISAFAQSYARQNKMDWQLLNQAVENGRIAALKEE